MKEIKSLRKKREKHFLKSDGTMVAYLFDHDIHYLKDGSYKTIDKNLEETDKFFKNKAGSFNAKFIKNNKENQLLEILKEENAFFLSLKEKKLENTNILVDENKICYENVLENIDITYEVLEDKIKEIILLKDKTVSNNISFRVDPSYDYVFLNDKSILVKKNNKVILKIASPFMIDQTGEYNNNIFYQLENDELILNLDFDWLHDENRRYPVMIDPTLIVDDSSDISDIYIASNSTSNFNNSDMLKIGVSRENNEDVIYRTLLKFDLPTIGTGCQVTDARLNLFSHVSDKVKDTYEILDVIDTHAINSSWDEGTATWVNTQNNYDERVEMCSLLNRTSVTIDENENIVYLIKQNKIDITNIVRKWYTGRPNYGVLLKAHDETYNENAPVHIFYSKSHTLNDDVKPMLEIYYRNLNGIEDYLSYETQEYLTGKSYVNRLTGNLTTDFLLNETINGTFPVSLSLIYNTNDVILNNDYGYKAGYLLNLAQRIKEVTIDETLYLEYLDQDGTIHYFMKNNDIYEDQDGLGLSAKKEDNFYILTDQNGNKLKFNLVDTVWYLTEIIDTSLNKITIVYNSENKIVKVIDGDNNEILITYDSNKITCTSDNRTTVVNYSNNKVSSINSVFGVTSFTYNNNGILDKIIDISGKSIGFTYYDNLPYRINTIKEYGISNGEGASLTFKYGFDKTTIIDQKGFYNTYTFNANGSVVGVTNLNGEENIRDGYGKAYWYYDSSLHKKAINKLGLDHGLIKSVHNYIPNSSFEDNENLFIATRGVSSISSFTSRSGSKSLKVATENDTIALCSYETSALKGYDYTFSFYALSDDIASVKIFYTNKSGATVYKTIVPNSPDEFKRYDTTIYYPTTALSSLQISISLVSSGISYFDDMQLEASVVCNNYNFVDNSLFKDDLTGWEISSSSLKNGMSLPIDDCYSFATLSDGTKALKINSDPYKQIRLDKTLNVSGNKGDVYNLSFWYKNGGVVSDVYGNFNHAIVRFEYHNNDDGHCVPLSYPFTLNDEEWQFFSTTFVAEEDYDKIYLSILDVSNANNLYLTNFSLFRDLEKNSFIYDLDTGNLVNVSLRNKTNTEFSYDKNNQLTNMFEPSGTNFRFEYDNTVTNRLLSGVSSSGISNAISYDRFGNAIKTIVKNVYFDIDNPSGNVVIRKKGTNKYCDVNFLTKNISFIENSCSHDTFEIIKEGDYYRIKSTLLPYYFSYSNERVCLNPNLDDTTLFSIEKVSNGSYVISPKGANYYLTDDNILKVKSNLNENNVLDVNLKETDKTVQFYIECIDNNDFIESNAIYSEDGKVIEKTIDPLGNETKYNIDKISGLTNEVIDANGNKISYEYNDKKQLVKVQESSSVVNYQYNEQGLLSTIDAGNKEYNFIYDQFLNEKTIKVNENTLITNQYETKNGNLKKSTYGNNNVISYTYDDMNRISTKTTMDNVYRYFYNNLGNLGKIITNNGSYKYYYDFARRISEYQFKNFDVLYDYDEFGRMSHKDYKLDSNSLSINYNFNDKDEIDEIDYQDNLVFNYLYDGLGRIKETYFNPSYKTIYQYVNKGNRTSPLIKSIKVLDDVYEYSYDKLNQITHVYLNNILSNKYFYDEFYELIQEEDYLNNKKICYQYDGYGNILSKKEYRLDNNEFIVSHNYSYGNDWKDQLTKFDNDVITYDEVGNPTKIGNKNLSWINGRSLQSYVDEVNNLNVQYTYNHEGIRSSKEVNGILTEYYLEDNKIIFEKRNNDIIKYIRDEKGRLLGFIYNNQKYFYMKNIQEDIIGILNSNYEVIARYEYDSWGNILSIKDENNNDISSDSNNIANINPFRYRSYYYDRETNLYYLNSRYYNPVWGRFINADGIIGANDDIKSYNLYSYVSNNFINLKDPSGNLAISVSLTGLIIAGLALLGAAYVAHTSTSSFWVAQIVDAADAIKDISFEKPKKKEKTKEEEKKHTVYTLRDEKDKVIYVGRTSNIVAREKSHKKNPYRSHLTLVKAYENLTYAEARGLEQKLILEHKTLNKLNKASNQVNGIRWDNPRYDEYMMAADVFLYGTETYVGG